MCNQETIDLIPITLPNGETVYVTCQDALARRIAMLVMSGIDSLTDRIMEIDPAEVLIWTGAAGVLLLTGAVILGATSAEPSPPPPKQKP